MIVLLPRRLALPFLLGCLCAIVGLATGLVLVMFLFHQDQMGWPALLIIALPIAALWFLGRLWIYGWRMSSGGPIKGFSPRLLFIICLVCLLFGLLVAVLIGYAS